MQSLKLSYFDFHGGRGEPIRAALFLGGIAFEDHRLKFPDWPAFKATTPFGSIPVMEIDGRSFAQSNSLLRYVGKLAGLYPSDPLEALLADEAMDAVEDAAHSLNQSFETKGEEEKKRLRLAAAEGKITQVLTGLDRKLNEAGGKHFAGGALSVADIKVFYLCRWLKSGVLDYVPTDLVERVSPAVSAHFEAIAAHPKIVEYYAQFGRSP